MIYSLYISIIGMKLVLCSFQVIRVALVLGIYKTFYRAPSILLQLLEGF